MSTPQNSTKPVTRTGSSPLLASGKTSVVQLSEEVSAWIEGLSPSGASVYDTGWVTLTPDAGFTPAALFIRRQGKRVSIRGAVTRDAGVWPGDSTVMTLPAGFRPVAFCRFAVVGPTHATAYGLGVTINSAGVLSVYRLGTAQSATVHLDGVSYFVD